MSRPPTLNEMAQLQGSGFGRPKPRHGLKLLYWFANECVEFDGSTMSWRFDPEDGECGFHPFQNRHEQTGEQLLPDSSYPYYEVGNLTKPGADHLPHYIWTDYTGNHHDRSNQERIIVSVDDECFDKVYVTRHLGQSNYNTNKTYRISKGLLKIISSMTLDDFLSDAGY